MVRDGQVGEGRKSSCRRRLELQHRLAGTLRGDSSCGLPPTSVLLNKPQGSREGNSVVRKTPYWRDLLQPHAVRVADRQLHRASSGKTGGGRLEALGVGISATESQPKLGTSRCAAPDRKEA